MLPRENPAAHHAATIASAAERADNDTDTDEDLRLLLAPGSSLGGARPEASVPDRDGHLAIAKFPSKADDMNTVVWEAAALTRAAKAGITVPDSGLKPPSTSQCYCCDGLTTVAACVCRSFRP